MRISDWSSDVCSADLPRPRRKWRLEARLALLALEAFEHRGLFAADIGARAAMDEDVEIIARAARVLAAEALAIGLGDGGKEVQTGRGSCWESVRTYVYI